MRVGSGRLKRVGPLGALPPYPQFGKSKNSPPFPLPSHPPPSHSLGWPTPTKGGARSSLRSLTPYGGSILWAIRWGLASFGYWGLAPRGC